MSRSTAPRPIIDEPMLALLEQLEEFNRHGNDKTALWVADEHPLPEKFFELASASNLVFISNRFDQHQLATQRGIHSHFSDMDFSMLDQPDIDTIFFRIPKERALAHRVINQASQALPPDGALWLSGYKNQGAKTLIASAENSFNSKAAIDRGPRQRYLAQIPRGNKSATNLNDNDYSDMRSISIDGFSFLSKPGLYGWNKVDAGSRLLSEWLTSHPEYLANKKVLDLGCGYGYLAMLAQQLGAAEITTTDNCAAALAACEQNLSALPIKTRVLASNAGHEIDDSFDVILCNPPFHQGFSTTPELHEKFLRETARLLKKDGRAWYVVNQFLEIATVSRRAGLNANEVTKSKSFKIVELSA